MHSRLLLPKLISYSVIQSWSRKGDFNSWNSRQIEVNANYYWISHICKCMWRKNAQNIHEFTKRKKKRSKLTLISFTMPFYLCALYALWYYPHTENWTQGMAKLEICSYVCSNFINSITMLSQMRSVLGTHSAQWWPLNGKGFNAFWWILIWNISSKLRPVISLWIWFNRSHQLAI